LSHRNSITISSRARSFVFGVDRSPAESCFIFAHAHVNGVYRAASTTAAFSSCMDVCASTPTGGNTAVMALCFCVALAYDSM
jgi:hypothetical protein